MKPVVIGTHTLDIPIIQGGMGVGISRASLAGAVAKEGAMGVISAALSVRYYLTSAGCRGFYAGSDEGPSPSCFVL